MLTYKEEQIKKLTEKDNKQYRKCMSLIEKYSLTIHKIDDKFELFLSQHMSLGSTQQELGKFDNINSLYLYLLGFDAGCNYMGGHPLSGY